MLAISFSLAEQHFFDKVKQLSQCQEDFLRQTQEHSTLQEELEKIGNSELCETNLSRFLILHANYVNYVFDIALL